MSLLLLIKLAFNACFLNVSIIVELSPILTIFNLPPQKTNHTLSHTHTLKHIHTHSNTYTHANMHIQNLMKQDHPHFIHAY
jgi:hypothetical protein